MKSYKTIIKTACLIFSLFFAGCISSSVKREQVDQHVFNAVRDAIAEMPTYQRIFSFRPFLYTVSQQEGIISTDWFLTHKGEVKLKVICNIEGKKYYITVTQQMLFRQSDDTKWTNLCKRKLKEKIEEKINKNP